MLDGVTATFVQASLTHPYSLQFQGYRDGPLGVSLG